jgi:hypothetical protein
MMLPVQVAGRVSSQAGAADSPTAHHVCTRTVQTGHAARVSTCSTCSHLHIQLSNPLISNVRALCRLDMQAG